MVHLILMISLPLSWSLLSGMFMHLLSSPVTYQHWDLVVVPFLSCLSSCFFSFSQITVKHCGYLPSQVNVPWEYTSLSPRLLSMLRDEFDSLLLLPVLRSAPHVMIWCHRTRLLEEVIDSSFPPNLLPFNPLLNLYLQKTKIRNSFLFLLLLISSAV